MILKMLMNGIDGVQNEDDMFELMDSVTYYQMYDPYNCKYDPRSESVGVKPFATYEELMKEENKEIVYEAMNEVGKQVLSMSRQQQQNKNEYWESTFTEVINCNEKTLLVRFFEDDNRVIKLSVE